MFNVEGLGSRLLSSICQRRVRLQLIVVVRNNSEFALRYSGFEESVYRTKDFGEGLAVEILYTGDSTDVNTDEADWQRIKDSQNVSRLLSQKHSQFKVI